ncbi:MAG: hypothetical protein KGZ80_00385 [Methylomonas sp.]|nr:hypothetical protein [Methylomonas sp.]
MIEEKNTSFFTSKSTSYGTPLASGLRVQGSGNLNSAAIAAPFVHHGKTPGFGSIRLNGTRVCGAYRQAERSARSRAIIKKSTQSLNQKGVYFFMIGRSLYP